MRSDPELSFRREAARLRLVVEQARDIVLLLSTQGRIVDANEAAVKAYGYKREELLGLEISRLRAEGTTPEVQRQIQEACEAGVLFETMHRRKDGTHFSVEVSACRADIAGDDLIISIIRDISPRKKIENALRLTQFSVDNAADATVWIERDGRIFYANKSASALLGYPNGLLTGMSILDVDGSISVDDWTQHWERIKQRGSATFETTQRTRDGRLLPVEVTATHLCFDGHELHCSYFRSIEQRKLLEEQLRQSQKMDAMGRLAGGIAHDFNNLLMVISSYAELLESDSKDASAIQRLGAIRLAADRGAALTQQLLAFSRKQVLQASVLDLNGIVQQIADIALRFLGENIELKIVTDPRIDQVRVDPGQLQQVLLELVINARDAMPQGGKLTIQTANVEVEEANDGAELGLSMGSYVLVSVTDNGCGMDSETCKRCFEPFFTTKPPGTSSGLGLSTAYGIVKQSGGSIRLKTELGNGTAVCIYFPAVNEASRAPAVVDSSNAQARGQTVLLVEDEPFLRDVIATYMTQSGYHVLSAGNYDEALRCARSNRRIDVLVTDVILPGVGGRDVAEGVRREVPTVRIMYMSGYTFDAVSEEDLLAGGAQFLQKPFTKAQLLAAVHKLLHS